MMSGRAGIGCAIALAAAAAACRRDVPAPVTAIITGPQLTFEPSGRGTLVRLIVPDSQEINARIPPAIELSDGSVLRFAAAGVTPDSAYYTEAPVAWLSYPADTLHGLLRAGICNRGELVCRAVKVRL